MANPAPRLIQDQNPNIIHHGTIPGGKIDGAEADMKKCIEAREKAADMKMDYEESKAAYMKMDHDENTMKHFEVDDDDDDDEDEDDDDDDTIFDTIDDDTMIEGFLHNHEECIKAQKEGVARQADYLLKEYFTAHRMDLPLSSKKKPENTMKHFEIDDDDDDDDDDYDDDDDDYYDDVDDEKMPDMIMGRFLHNHEECIKAEEEAVNRLAVNMFEYFTGNNKSC